MAGKIKSRSMNKEDCIVGAKVICVYNGGFYGTIGEIASVIKSSDGSIIYGYHVKDLNGEYIGKVGWTHLTSFNIIIDDMPSADDSQSESKNLPLKDFAKDLSINPTVSAPEKKPCPSYYYGLAACTCGNCRNKFKNY